MMDRCSETWWTPIIVPMIGVHHVSELNSYGYGSLPDYRKDIERLRFGVRQSIGALFRPHCDAFYSDCFNVGEADKSQYSTQIIFLKFHGLERPFAIYAAAA